MDELKLKDDLGLGVASSATQIEGSDRRNTWYDWYKKGYIKDASSPLRANDHYNLYKEDIDLMAKMGIKYYRLGIEWSRIEPTKGVFNNGEIKHYRDLITYLVDSGITPLLTLHHFTNPMWFENLGGFENDACVEIFLHYVKKIVEELGDLVSEYITINEPNVYALNGYFFGAWPPGKQNIKIMGKVLTNMAKCHITAYSLIHNIRKEMGYNDTKVSYAIHMRVFEPKDEKSAYQKFAAKKIEQYFQTSIAKAMTLGECIKPIKKLGLPKGIYSDFIALNYYTRSTVTGFEDGVKEFAPVNDLGWEIYPEGINICAKKLYDIAPMPIYVTENGTCDNTDDFRIKFIYEHLKAVTESDLPYQRYYHWSFTDNFEWLEGESARFGLVSVNYETQERTVKKSGEFYSEVIEKQGITEEIALKYTGQYYKRADGSVIGGIDDVYFDYEKTLKSEIGNTVVTNVSKFVENPAGYNEDDEREKAGILVNKEFIHEVPITAAIEDVAIGVLNEGEVSADDECVEALDEILDRNPNEAEEICEETVSEEIVDIEEETAEAIEAVEPVEESVVESYEDEYDSLTEKYREAAEEVKTEAVEEITETEAVEAAQETDTEIESYENDYDSLIEEYEAAKEEVEAEVTEEPVEEVALEDTPDLLDEILDRAQDDVEEAEVIEEAVEESEPVEPVEEVQTEKAETEQIEDKPAVMEIIEEIKDRIEETAEQVIEKAEDFVEKVGEKFDNDDEIEPKSDEDDEVELDDDDYIGMFLS